MEQSPRKPKKWTYVLDVITIANSPYAYINRRLIGVTNFESSKQSKCHLELFHFVYHEVDVKSCFINFYLVRFIL